MENNDFIRMVRSLRESAELTKTTFDYLRPYHNEDLFADGNPEVRKDKFNGRKIVNIADLYPNQAEIDVDLVNNKQKGKLLKTPYVLKYNNKLILMDGHHTVIAKKLNGVTKVKVLFYDMDAEKNIP